MYRISVSLISLSVAKIGYIANRHFIKYDYSCCPCEESYTIKSVFQLDY